MDLSRPLISIVTPCYNEEDNVRDCYEAVQRLFEGPLAAYDREHIFCDNNSSDRTVALLRTIAAQDPSVKVIVNARNFGPFRSTFNGLMNTRGDAVLVALAADLQDPPELIPALVAKWRAGHEVVYGIRRRREEGLVIRTVRKAYYRLLSRFAEVSIPIDAGEFQLVDRVVIEALRGFDDYYPYIRGMIASCGFRSTGIPYTWKSRAKGFSKNRLYHLIDQALNGLISFTRIPMRMCLLAGLSISLLSILYALASFVWNLIFFRQVAPAGVATLIVGLFFFSGLQLFFLGVMGEYISAIHSQVRKGPVVIERERINFEGGLTSGRTAHQPQPGMRRPHFAVTAESVEA
jgi:glycosyltransferase involved in cell wall biosynthesis